jgi:hypothetical protein
LEISIKFAEYLALKSSEYNKNRMIFADKKIIYLNFRLVLVKITVLCIKKVLVEVCGSVREGVNEVLAVVLVGVGRN